MNQVILYGAKAREELVRGADFLAECVISTLGPFGSNFFLDKKNTITNDGVSVARAVQISSDTLLPDGRGAYIRGNEVNNRGAAALREAASKTNDIAGDGTTTAILLSQAIYKAVSKFLSKENVIGSKKPSEVIKQIEAERVEVTEKLKAFVTPIETEAQLIKSAVVSTEDKELGELIGKAQWELGPNGFLLVEDTAERTSSVEKVKGVRIDNGFGTSALINNAEKGTLEVEDCPIVLTSLTMKGIGEWKPFMERIVEPLAKQGKRALVIVARAWTDETVKFCMANHEAGMDIYPLSAPYVNMNERMKDLAAVTGAFYYDSEHSNIDDMMASGLGYVQKITAKRMEAILMGKSDEKTDASVAKRVEQLEQELIGEVSEFAKKALQERIAQLENGFAIVKVGSPSDMEKRRLLDKAVDATNAVRAALQEGTVAGAGLAFKQVADTLPDTYILKRPLMALNEQIMASAPKDFVVEDWVRDPYKVLRVALEQACVAASAFATAGGVITDKQPEPLDQLLRHTQ